MTPEILALLVSVVAAVSALIAAIVLPRLTSKNRSDIGRAYQTAVFAVHAAEQMFQPGNGPTKLKYAVDRVLETVGISEEQARMLVEAAVRGAGFGKSLPTSPPPLHVVA